MYACIFSYDPLSSSDCGRSISGIAKGAVLNRLFLTNGMEEKFTGLCFYFLRTKTDVNISLKNIAEVV